jgi:hypothetical protein
MIKNQGIDLLPTQEVSTIYRQERNIAAAFQQIELRGDVTLFLVRGIAGKLWLKGNSRDLDRVRTIVKTKVLIIDAQRKKTDAALIIYIAVAGVMPLIINGDAELFSPCRINTEELEIFLYGEARVTMSCQNKVKITAIEE